MGRAVVDAGLVLGFIAVFYFVSLGSDAIGIPILGLVIRILCFLFAFYVVALFARRLFVVGRYVIAGGDPTRLAIDFLSAGGDGLGVAVRFDPESIPSRWELNDRARLARELGPHDIVSRGARGVVFVWSTLLLLLLPVRILTTAAGGCLWALTFGVFGLILQWAWVPFELLILGTSRIWLRWWPTRLVLLVPGLVVALAAGLFLTIVPEPNERLRYLKLSIADEWPYSWYVVKPEDIPGLPARLHHT